MRLSIKTVGVLAISLLLTACADHAVQNRGGESVAYQEVHRFDLTFETQEQKLEELKLEDIVSQFDLQQAQFELVYPREMTAKSAELYSFLRDLHIRPERISLVPAESEQGLVMLISQWQSVTDNCQPLTITKPLTKAGCSVETNRTIHLVNPGARVN
ncbi:hypothetical protein JCM19241_2839 [Vibrio ishigakensis]|uniref:Uncharacterized protein n=1 Tax=Vibrio ishigakensis TaxID=1481914 RepID=A0A0B8QFI0_9VIBR|nr:hypothetical protein JCM19241_2839 [Vibrio ishigakensis]